MVEEEKDYKMILLETTFLQEKSTGIAAMVTKIIAVFLDKKIDYKTISYYDYFKRKNVFLWFFYYNILLNIRIAFMPRSDVFLMPANIGGMLFLIKRRAQNMVIINDLFEISECKNKFKKYINHKRFAAIIHATDRVLTISKTSCADIEKAFPFAKDKIIVLHLFVGPSASDIKACSSTIIDTVHNGPYILANGSGQERKNVSFIIQNMTKIFEDFKVRLVLFGKDFYHNNYRDVYDEINQCRCSHLVTHIGEVSDEELSVLYKSALCFVFPSLEEGFGFPPLEALTHGCRIIVSNIPVFREVCFNLDCFFDFNYPSLSQALRQAINEDEISFEKKRQALLQEYSYDHYAARLVDILLSDVQHHTERY